MWLRIFFTPVTPDCKKGDNKFTGKMNKVTIELKKMSAADEEARQEGRVRSSPIRRRSKQAISAKLRAN
jgi:hypothetical protein